jgi:16S rRNA (cytidine1402-2'-O)-methyltransferase
MLYLVATPIGNLEDITFRAIRVLKEVDLILAEDTRKTGLLLKHFNIEKRLRPFFDHNEAQILPGIIEELKAGKNLVLVSSAGTPTICDPGYKLVRECRKLGLAVTSLPGPSSSINAVALSGLPHDKFVFVGYLPRKDGARRKILEKTAGLEAALVFLESPFRLIKSLESLNQVLPGGKITVCREMTKKFEEVFEGTIGEAIEHFNKNQPRGEFTVVAGLKDLQDDSPEK